MNIEEKQRKVKELEEETLRLRSEITKDYREKYLPILKEKAKISYSPVSFEVEIDNNIVKELLKEQDEKGWYHWGVDITDQVTLSGNDGKLDLIFKVGGTLTKMEDDKIQICKELGLKVDFSSERKRLSIDLEKAKKRLERLDILEKKYYDR